MYDEDLEKLGKDYHMVNASQSINWGSGGVTSNYSRPTVYNTVLNTLKKKF